MIPAPTTIVELSDGRLLAADDVGDRGGAAVLYLHGSPDCRLARHPDDGIATRLGIRLIAIDRPGYGRSDPQPQPDVRAWGDDLSVLLDHLGIGAASVAAWSAGAPWAFGLAAARPERIQRVVTFGCLAPLEAFDDDEVAIASGSRRHVAAALASGTTIDEFVAELGGFLLPPAPVAFDIARDVVVEAYSPRALAEVEAVPGLVDQLARSLQAAVDRHGEAGLASDMQAQFTLGLPQVLADVRCGVVLVHGEHDPIAGPAVGRWMAERVDRAAVEVWPRGHQGLLAEWERWLALSTAS